MATKAPACATSAKSSVVVTFALLPCHCRTSWRLRSNDQNTSAQLGMAAASGGPTPRNKPRRPSAATTDLTMRIALDPGSACCLTLTRSNGAPTRVRHTPPKPPASTASADILRHVFHANHCEQFLPLKTNTQSIDGWTETGGFFLSFMFVSFDAATSAICWQVGSAVSAEP